MPANINLSQAHLYNQFDAYLKQIGHIEGVSRENNLAQSGDCVGWSFLFGYYNNISKGKEFTDIQTYISTWDKNIASLQTNKGMSNTLKNKYGNGIKLFEQTLNDVVWFSQIKSKVLTNYQLSQNDRVEQFDYVSNHKHQLNNIFSFLNKSNTNITLEELPDFLKIAQQWENSWLDLGVYATVNNKTIGHAMSIYINANGSYTYFDSNNTQKTVETNSAEMLSQTIFKALGAVNLELKDFSLYQFTNLNQRESLDYKDSLAFPPLNINKAVGEKFLEMSLVNHQLDPIYKLLSTDNKNSAELIKKYETALFYEASEKGHVQMTDLLIKHNPDLAPLKLTDLLPNSLSDFFDSVFAPIKSSAELFINPVIHDNLTIMVTSVDFI